MTRHDAARPVLEILIPSLQWRAENRERLFATLRAQITRYHLERSVIITCKIDAGELSQGAKRNLLLRGATGEYISSVDDDDMVSEDYVVSIVESIYRQPDVDVVTLRSRRTINGDAATAETLIFDLAQKEPSPGPSFIYLLPPNHVCAWKLSLAQRCEFAEDLPYGCDQVWWKPLLMSGCVQTQIHIPRVLYYYNYTSDNDGAAHDAERTREACRMMGPGWRRQVYRDVRTGNLVTSPDFTVPARHEHLGEIWLS